MLDKTIRELIISQGPVRLDQYMGLCAGHYYNTHDPFLDFITAPEISQVFGELIGVWCVAQWQAMGSPAFFNLVELGPGRGTLMNDVLRAAKIFRGPAQIHLVETSPRLRAIQGQSITATWHDTLTTVPEGPMLLIANEFFDALAIRQFETRDGKWHERVIGLADDHLQIGLIPTNPPPASRGRWHAQHDGGGGAARPIVIEYSPARNAIAAEISARLARHPGAALIIDYGHDVSAPGDTLQAMRQHKYIAITDHPGDCDLTSHVDFETLRKAFAHSAILEQRDFLLAMGLEQRIAALSARADSATQGVLQRAMSRLADKNQMGKLFKVMAAWSPGFPTPYPFGTA